MNRAKQNEYARRWYAKNRGKPGFRERHNEKVRRCRERHREGYNAGQRERYQRDRDKILFRLRERNRKDKEEVLTHYGNGKLACVICEESRVACLSLDHIGNDGYADRKRRGRWSWTLYRWLRANYYPEGYQTLCMNCQFIKKAERDL